MVFIHYSQAFDTILHTLLCVKLDHFRFNITCGQFFISYLTCRRQKVVVNSIRSGLLALLSCALRCHSLLAIYRISSIQRSGSLSILRLFPLVATVRSIHHSSFFLTICPTHCHFSSAVFKITSFTRFASNFLVSDFIPQAYAKYGSFHSSLS